MLSSPAYQVDCSCEHLLLCLQSYCWLHVMRRYRQPTATRTSGSPQGVPRLLRHLLNEPTELSCSGNRSALLAQIPVQNAEDNLCWYERTSASLLLIVGDFCNAHHEYYFAREARDAWKLNRAENVPVMICDERASENTRPRSHAGKFPQ